MYFTPQQVDQLNQTAQDLERRTGAQVVAAVVDKADAYPEIPWKAFALGSVSSAFTIWLWQIMTPVPLAPLGQLAPVLGVGVTAALLTIFWPGFARLFLDTQRGAGEVDQYARALFLERQIFHTPERTGVLVLVSLFERRVVILPDRGVGDRLEARALQAIVAHMTRQLQRGERFGAFAEGLARLEAALVAAGFTAQDENENHLPDALIQREGGHP